MKKAIVVFSALLAIACGGGQARKAPRTAEAPGEAAPPAEPAVAQADPAPGASSEPPAHEPEAKARIEAPPEPPGGAEPRPSAARPEPPPEPPPLPKGTTVLHIGDSFAGALGIELNRRFKEHGVRGILKYETATYIPTWAWKKELDQYLWSYRPDLVLITLGANELEIPDPQMRAKTIRRLVERVGDRPCVWVAPPLWEGARDVLLPVIEENCAPCVYMSNEDIAPSLERARDKIHPSMNARKVWAAHVLDWLARHRDPDAERPWEIQGDGPPASARAAETAPGEQP